DGDGFGGEDGVEVDGFGVDDAEMVEMVRRLCRGCGGSRCGMAITRG
nr:hypothetical protein [Tanacetum cinerariifolium]